MTFSAFLQMMQDKGFLVGFGSLVGSFTITGTLQVFILIFGVLGAYYSYRRNKKLYESGN